MKIGLLLEGGGMRGLYTAGVLDIFMEKQIRIDGIIGVSAGAFWYQLQIKPNGKNTKI